MKTQKTDFLFDVTYIFVGRAILFPRKLFIGAFLSRTAGTSFTDVRPSFPVTTSVMRQALYHDPILGLGAGLIMLHGTCTIQYL